MCGIAGYTGRETPGRLDAMLSRMVHRGPDDWGSFDADGFHVGMRRLSIVDIDGGKQPMFNRAKTAVVVFNGEIYNAPELRRTLEEKGYPFVTANSDTEVIAHLYDEYGLGLVDHIWGMFAICLVDLATRELFLIRDRLGKKPIFYAFDEGSGAFQFASEFNALALPGRTENLDPSGLPWLFGQRSMPQETTSDRRARKLAPGTYLRLPEVGGPELKRYWSIRPSVSRASDISDEAAIDRLDELLKDAVKLRMRADATVGAYLSGGIDSSLVSTLASQLTAKPLDTYCLVYEKEIYNKSSDQRFAREISRRLGSNHHEVLLTPERLISELPGILAHFGQPYGGSVANWFVSKAMFGKVKVALSGDGADELFGSYLLHRVAAAEPSDYGRLEPKERELALLAEREPFERIISAFSVFSPDEEKALLRPEVLVSGSCAERISRRFRALQAEGRLDRMLEYECNFTLVDVILSYTDTLSMGHSIEVRSPFLDHRIVDFAFSLPARLKIRDGTTKYVLKRLAERYLPAELVHRKKEGFIEPAIKWLEQELKELCYDTLASQQFNRLGLLNRTYVDTLVSRFYESKDFYLGKKVWALVMYGLWERAYCGP